ncbi:hypothetical protein BVI1335_2960007 [Burkholderia vietnamiensis]|nr:hypothetical protein BVI1335_2960007 [Burkholderia vietnamiensis]
MHVEIGGQLAAGDRAAQQRFRDPQDLQLKQRAPAQQCAVFFALFALRIENHQHALHRARLAALPQIVRRGAPQRRERGQAVRGLEAFRRARERAVAQRQTDFHLVAVMPVYGAARHPGRFGEVGHRGLRDALFEQHELGGVENPVLDGERFFPGLAGHGVNFLTVRCRFIETVGQSFDNVHI